MKQLRFLFCAVAALAVAIIISGRSPVSATQSYVTQIGVMITVNVTPAPMVFTVHRRIRAARIVPSSAEIVAQTQAQNSVGVRAKVTPNPLATILTANQYSANVNAVAGQTKSFPCLFSVTVHTATAKWVLDGGLSNDFTTSWPGSDLSYAMYVGAAPSPETYTAFVVYPDNNNVGPAVLPNGAGTQTYCVDLSLSIPATVPSGAYSTTAVYSLYM
jgi:hypothetical protein